MSSSSEKGCLQTLLSGREYDTIYRMIKNDEQAYSSAERQMAKRQTEIIRRKVLNKTKRRN